ncbi:MAG: endonuclease/exonuclease/phosphatase family protein [Clostridia bacterium]|nr:endonuclease/exonuclease/phosphatase family protein [Clostridia bacterium]
MKLMTFNTQHCMNYITREIDFEIMAKAIRDQNPDIVGLNEMRNLGTKEDYTDQVKALSDLSGMPHYYFAQAISFEGKNPYGNGMLSKIPFKTVETVMIPDPIEKTGDKWYETRCILKATFANGLTVLVTHFGLNDDEQQNAVETILKNIAPEKCIVMGDLNVRPDNPLLDPIRACMQDTAKTFKAPLLSFPSDNPYCKIDYIFATPDIEIVSADIPAVVASDHRPHTAEIQF